VENNSGRDLLILFTRYPQAGKAKTRLIPALGPQGAAELQKRMTEQAVGQIKKFLATQEVAAQICYEGGNELLLRDWLAVDLPCLPQGAGSLGERLELAFRTAFAEGVGRVVIVGSDCPGLNPAIFARAFAALARHDLVLGPATDGGYYLIGLAAPQPYLFREIPWGGSEVFETTRSRADLLQLSTHCLEQLADVDRPEDLRHFGDYPYSQ